MVVIFSQRRKLYHRADWASTPYARSGLRVSAGYRPGQRAVWLHPTATAGRSGGPNTGNRMRQSGGRAEMRRARQQRHAPTHIQAGWAAQRTIPPEVCPRTAPDRCASAVAGWGSNAGQPVRPIRPAPKRCQHKHSGRPADQTSPIGPPASALSDRTTKRATNRSPLRVAKHPPWGQILTPAKHKVKTNSPDRCATPYCCASQTCKFCPNMREDEWIPNDPQIHALSQAGYIV